ncbi:MAG: replication endonuclease [Pseudomonadales bacterium]|nr:replication endonuclease [Pseudomonadales bacterium]
MASNGLDRAGICHWEVTGKSSGIRTAILRQHPQLAQYVSTHYIRLALDKGIADATRNLYHLQDTLVQGDFSASMSPSSLKAFAKLKASYCRQIANHESSEQAYRQSAALAASYDLMPPQPHGTRTVLSCLNRLCADQWWLKHLRNKQARTIEAVARDIGLVNRCGAAYSSHFAQARRQSQRELASAFMDSTYIRNDEGQEFSLREIAEGNTSNPAVRRTELMVRLNGFEMVANQLGHEAVFYTITAPSRMHARLGKSGKANPKYDGTNILAVHRFMHRELRCALAKLKRNNVYVYGFRVVEPHHDGTPHYHLLLFTHPEHTETASNTLKEYAMREDSHERGASSSRFKAEKINSAKGSATGYIAKYISKNIDGKHIEQDHLGNTGEQAAKAIDAWASIHGIRQFQQIGGPSVSVWRELRRLSRQTEKHQATLSNNTELMEAMLAADSANWAAFTLAMGGEHFQRPRLPLRLHYETAISVSPMTGEITGNKVTRFGDAAPARLVGLLFGEIVINTHHQRWEVIRRRREIVTASAQLML